MNDDPLDLLNDDGDGVIEMSLIEEEEERKKKKKPENAGCSVFLIASSAILLSAVKMICRIL